MAFESLSDKLQNIFKNLRRKGRLTEADVKAALREVRLALLEADVSFKVVKSFMKSVQEKAIGADVMNGLNPGQMVIKIVNDELVSLMGSETTELALKPAGEITVTQASACRLRHLQTRRDQAASGERGEAGRRGLRARNFRETSADRPGSGCLCEGEGL